MNQLLLKFPFLRGNARSRILLVLVGLVCLIAFMAYSLWFAPQITLGLITPLSGDFAVFAGKDLLNGAELAVEQANRANQGRGFLVNDRYYRIKLAIADDRNNPQGIIDAADKLLGRHAFGWLFPKPIALLTSPQSSLILPLASQLRSRSQSQNLPLITAATDPAILQQSPQIIPLGLDHTIQGAALATFARQTLKSQRAAILYNPDNYYSQNLVTAFQNTLERLGGKVVIMATYRGDRPPDWGKQFRSIAQAEPDVLLLPNYLPDLISQGQELKKLAPQLNLINHLINLNLPLLGGESWAGLISANLPLMEGGFFLSSWHPQLPDGQNQQFVKDYTRVYRQPPRPHAALAYDGVQMVLRAIAEQKAPNSANSPELFRAMQKPFLGVTGEIFGSSGRTGVINQIKNGEAEFYQKIQGIPERK